MFFANNHRAHAFQSLLTDPLKVFYDVWFNPNDPECFARLCVMIALIATAIFLPYIIKVAFRSLEKQYKADLKAAVKALKGGKYEF